MINSQIKLKLAVLTGLTSSKTCLCHSWAFLFPALHWRCARQHKQRAPLRQSQNFWLHLWNKAQTSFPISHSLSLIYSAPLLAFSHTQVDSELAMGLTHKMMEAHWLRSSSIDLDINTKPSAFRAQTQEQTRCVGAQTHFTTYFKYIYVLLFFVLFPATNMSNLSKLDLRWIRPLVNY